VQFCGLITAPLFRGLPGEWIPQSSLSEIKLHAKEAQSVFQSSP
jgi:hypothetical protein